MILLRPTLIATVALVDEAVGVAAPVSAVVLITPTSMEGGVAAVDGATAGLEDSTWKARELEVHCQANRIKANMKNSDMVEALRRISCGEASRKIPGDMGVTRARLQPGGDEGTLCKAARVAANKNLETGYLPWNALVQVLAVAAKRALQGGHVGGLSCSRGGGNANLRP